MTRSGPLAAIALAAFAALPAGAQIVTLDAAGQRRLGVVTAPLIAGGPVRAATAFARVLDPIPLVTLDSDIQVAVATAAASAAEAARTRALALDDTIARKVAQAAAAPARGDTARLQLLRRRLALEWGTSIAALSDRRRGALVAGLVAGRSALVRIDSPGGSLHRTAGATLDLGANGQASARILGPARTVDPRQSAPAVLALVGGRNAGLLATGLTLPVRLSPSGGRAGVIVPAAAILRQNGRRWAYVRRGSNRFERRALGNPAPAAGGGLMATGFAVGEQVVVRGGAQLYVAEHAAGGAAD